MSSFSIVRTAVLLLPGLVLTAAFALADATPNEERMLPNPAKAEVEGPPALASVHGKYRTLLHCIEVPEDEPQYKRFTDYGFYNGTEWRNHKNLQPGYWVYVYPNWYIWRDVVKAP
jgi:hypothetical protein